MAAALGSSTQNPKFAQNTPTFNRELQLEAGHEHYKTTYLT
jgi:hypothetical protein